jgi:hypothetical protein
VVNSGKEVNKMGRNMQKMYQWRKDNQKRYDFYIHKKNDKDVYEKLESVDNKRKYIIDLIRADLKKEED